MIYLFMQDKTLNDSLPIIDENDIKDFKETKQKNGTYDVLAEIKVTNDDGFNIYQAVNDSDYVGFYDEHSRFQLHKITDIGVQNDFFIVEGVHLFFDEAKAGAIIRDRRFVDAEAYQAAPAAFDPIGWTMENYDTTVRGNINFYHETPLECKEKLIDTFDVEFDFWIAFDGQKITGKYYNMLENIGSESSEVYEYGDNIISITHEQNRSEVYTSVIGRGKGEEVGEDAYGRRITYEDIVWSTSNGDPLDKPRGERELIHPEATQAWGYVDDGVVKPRVAHVEFEEIEDERLLLEESHEWLLQNSVPKATFSLNLPDARGHDLGDSIAVVYRDIRLVKRTRVNILEVNHKTKRRKVEFGDSSHFRSNQRLNEIDRSVQRQRRRYDSMITQLKDEFTADFDEKMRQAREEFEQYVIDMEAEVEARRERMENEWQEQWDSGMQDINESIEAAEQKAEEEIQRKTDEVQGNLDRFADDHSRMLEEVKGNVVDIDDFLGDKSRSLREQFSELESGIRTDINAEAGRIDAVLSDIDDHSSKLTELELSTEGLGLTVAELDEWKNLRGADFEMAVDAINTKVWNNDIHNPNLIPFSDVTNPEHREYWAGRMTNLIGTSYQDWVRVRNTNASSHIGYQSPPLFIEGGRRHTISWLAWSDNPYFDMTFNYCYIMQDSGNISLRTPDKEDTGETIAGNKIYKYTVTLTPSNDRENARILFGGWTTQEGVDVDFRMKFPKLELGSRATPYYTSFSGLEQRADEISLMQQTMDGEMVRQSEISLNNGVIKLGAVEIGDDELASILQVSPNSIDAITDNLNLTGNLNVRGQVESLSISAIEANISQIITSHLDANTITSEHVRTSTALVDKIFTFNAQVYTLTAKSAFIRDVRALSIEAVEADIAHVRSVLLDSNVIRAGHIQAGTALVDRVFFSNAMVEHLTAKTAFIRDIRAISIDAFEVNLTTMMNSMGQVEGGLSIRRPDGAYFVEQGLPKFGNPIITKKFIGSEVEEDGNNYVTSARGSHTFERAYCDHSGRYANFIFQPSMRWDSNSTSANMRIVIRPQNTPSGVTLSNTTEEFVVFRNNPNSTVTINVPLPAPTYEALSFTLEFAVIDAGNRNNFVQIRSNRCWISA